MKKKSIAQKGYVSFAANPVRMKMESQRRPTPAHPPPRRTLLRRGKAQLSPQRPALVVRRRRSGRNHKVNRQRSRNRLLLPWQRPLWMRVKTWSATAPRRRMKISGRNARRTLQDPEVSSFPMLALAKSSTYNLSELFEAGLCQELSVNRSTDTWWVGHTYTY